MKPPIEIPQNYKLLLYFKIYYLKNSIYRSSKAVEPPKSLSKASVVLLTVPNQAQKRKINLVTQESSDEEDKIRLKIKVKNNLETIILKSI
jgi:hypothetical protein